MMYSSNKNDQLAGPPHLCQLVFKPIDRSPINPNVSQVTGQLNYHNEAIDPTKSPFLLVKSC